MLRLSSRTLVGLSVSLCALVVHSLECTFDLEESLPIDVNDHFPPDYLCEFWDGTIREFLLTKDQMDKVTDLVDSGTIIPGQTIFNNPSASLTDEYIVIPSSNNPNIFHPPATVSTVDVVPVVRRHRQLVNPNRKLSKLSGQSHYLVVKVKDRNGLAHAHDLTTISDNIFGTSGDLINLKSQVTDCTAGALNVVAGYPSSATQAQKDSVDAHTVGVGHPVGVMELTLSIDITNATEAVSKTHVRDTTIAETSAKLGFTLPGPFDNVIFVLEDCYVGSCGWAGYASVGGWYQFYKKDYYRDPAVLLHEYGHNLGFAHSGKLPNDSVFAPYADHTCIMGNPLYGDDTGKMCFNPAKSYQSGWYTNKGGAGIVEFDPIAQSIWTGTLMGVGEWKDVGATAPYPVVIKIETGTSEDFFVGFNRAAGANSQNDEADDKVTLIQAGSNGNAYSQSWQMWTGASGETYTLDNFAGTGMDLIFHVTAIDLSTVPGTAQINIVLSGTAFPTPAPTCSPVFSALSNCPLGPYNLNPGFCPNGSCSLQKGFFFDVTAKEDDILLTAINFYAYESNTLHEVWTKAGSHDGYEGNQAAWILAASHTSLYGWGHHGVGNEMEDKAILSSIISVAAGSTQAFFITSPNANYGAVFGSSVATAGTLQTDDDYLQILNGKFTSTYWPSSLSSTGRPFAGSIEYAVSQEPEAGSSRSSPVTPAPVTTPAPVEPAPVTPAPAEPEVTPAPVPGPGSRARIIVTGVITCSGITNIANFISYIKAAIAAFLNVPIDAITIVIIEGGGNRRDLLLENSRRLQNDGSSLQVTVDLTEDCVDENCETSAQSTSTQIETNLGNTNGLTTSIQETGANNGVTELQNTQVDSVGGVSSDIEIEQTGGANGDPIILGLQNQVFKFEGRDGAWYSNLASQNLRWNMHFKKFESCQEGENILISAMSLSTSDEASSSDILIVTTPEPIPECREDPDLVCLGGGTLHISFDGGNSFVSKPGDYHYASQNRVVAHNTYGACSRKWHDYDISDNTRNSLRNGGRRMTVTERKPLDLLSDRKLTMIDPTECNSWIEDRLSNHDLFEQRGQWSTIYVESPLVSFHIEYRQSDWFDRKCDFQSLDAWMTTVSPKLQKTKWNGILGETKHKKYSVLTGAQIKTDRSQLLIGKKDSDYEVDGPFGTKFAALELQSGKMVTKVLSSVIETGKSIFANTI